MTPKDRLAAKVAHYERVIRAMQGETFFVQDEDGCLRRWHPPQVLPSYYGAEPDRRQSSPKPSPS
jgi:hypothetical protein